MSENNENKMFSQSLRFIVSLFYDEGILNFSLIASRNIFQIEKNALSLFSSPMAYFSIFRTFFSSMRARLFDVSELSEDPHSRSAAQISMIDEKMHLRDGVHVNSVIFNLFFVVLPRLKK